VVPVLFEDGSLLAVDKPAGALTVRGRMGEAEPSLLDELESARKEKLLLVHRLDRGTSGVLLFARTTPAQRVLGAAFEEGRVEKRYLALVRGEPPLAELTVDVALVPARRGKARPAAQGEEGKPAVTTFRVLERFKGFALLEALPRTGRTHQIRVHLKYAGYSLIVDSAYAGVERITRGELGLPGPDAPVLERTPLHASRVVLAHPVSGQPLTIESALPADLERALAALRQLR